MESMLNESLGLLVALGLESGGDILGKSLVSHDAGLSLPKTVILIVHKIRDKLLSY
jgi:hypothetical protein